MQPLLILLQVGLLSILTVWLFLSLRILRYMELFQPPLGARRIQFKLGIGDRLPCTLMSPELRMIRSSDAMFIYVSPDCFGCESIVSGITGLSKTYPGIVFVLLTHAEWQSFPALNPERVHRIVNPQLVAAIGITILPVALMARNGVIVESALINSAEDVESVILSGQKSSPMSVAGGS